MTLEIDRVPLPEFDIEDNSSELIMALLEGVKRDLVVLKEQVIELIKAQHATTSNVTLLKNSYIQHNLALARMADACAERGSHCPAMQVTE